MSNDVEIPIKSAAGELTRINFEIYDWSLALPGLKRRVVRFVALVRSAMYPGIFMEKPCSGGGLEKVVARHLRQAERLLREMLRDTIQKESGSDSDKLAASFIRSLPEVSEILKTDIQAAYEGDPAARSEREIMLAYPAFEAISIFRLAHSLHILGVPLIPRMMTEYAHRMTGIDIHPGATIGRYFFIDHGTGVVIGETCTIGEHVKLYQGVTLGAKSFALDENGHPVKGIKRHPDIDDGVVIYSGATILGGDTHIGADCVIGGNVWLTHSVPPGKKVFYSGGE